MNKVNVPSLKEGLVERVHTVYGTSRCEPMIKASFLHDLFYAIDSLVRYNREDPLIQNAVLELKHGDLTFRAFLILSVLYGAYTSPPNKVTILKDFVGMLDKDLGEEELTVCAYAEGKFNAFFPRLHKLWKSIREVYGAKEFDLATLPPTPYRAYTLFALNCKQDIARKIRTQELYIKLCVLQEYMVEIHELIDSQPKRR